MKNALKGRYARSDASRQGIGTSVRNTTATWSAPYALYDRDDGNHERAESALRNVLRGADLLTTNYVLLETCALLQHRLGLAALRAFSQEFVPLLRVEWIGEDEHRGGIEATLTASRKKLSLVDSISFQSMRRNGVQSAFAFDVHFREQGFDLIPA